MPSSSRTAVRRLFALLVAPVLLAFAVSAEAADAVSPSRLAEGGYAVMVRHALAPGTGDPANFELGDCGTQRNLNDVGRAQAKALGRHLRDGGLEAAKVYTSQWCRCRETAALLGYGEPEDLPALNSFYQRPEDREPNLTALREFLAGLPADGPTVILVTHQVTISGITGNYTGSGEGYVLRLDGTGEPPVAGPLDTP